MFIIHCISSITSTLLLLSYLILSIKPQFHLNYYYNFVECQQQQHTISSIKAEFTYILDEGYPIGSKLFGNIAGVDVDENSNVIIFHRGSHVWHDNTFDTNDVYQASRKSPIEAETVVTIDPKEKKIIRAWGKNTFFMPHGLSLDLESKNLWLTDVALHQVFKYPIDGSKELIVLGTAFVPGNDENHFCKPTSVADTGEFVFVADGYCNSRVVMFSAEGKYLGEFGQSPESAFLSNQLTSQPTFNVPHKITYAKESNMLCVADRENGRIQCFSFEPKHKLPEGSTGLLRSSGSGLDSDTESGLILTRAINPKFTIADPQFNGRLFSIDYCPIRGGVLVAVSGKSLYNSNKPALGFVYNVTTGQLISKFAPPNGKTFGMAHDLAVTNDGAQSIYVVDIAPVNLWRFSRPGTKSQGFKAAELTKMAGEGLNKAVSLIREQDHGYGFLWYAFLISVFGGVVFIVTKVRRLITRGGGGLHHNSGNLFPSFYSNNYSASINSLFGNNNHRGTLGSRGRGIGNNVSSTFSTLFSRRAFHNLFNRYSQQQNDFSRIPLDDDDNSDDDKSDSDVEEFNINQATTNIGINA